MTNQSSTHITEEQWSAVALNGQGAEAAAHLAGCAECAAEAERLRGALADYTNEARAGAEQPEHFWARQRRAIGERLAGHTAPARRFAWAGAMAAVMLMAGTFLYQAPVQQARPYDPDDELLRQVARSVQRPVPAALAPALLLAAEMNQAAEANTKPQQSTEERR